MEEYIMKKHKGNLKTNSISASKVRSDFADIINRVAFGEERILILRRGKEIGALIPLADLEILEKIEDKIDIEEARKAIEESEREGFISLEEFKKIYNL